MDVVKLMDLSFLTSKEQAIIQEVLKRDANLRKREEKRIRKMRRKILDNRSMKLQTGEWFEDLKAKRFLEYPSATDLLQGVFHHEAKSEFVQSKRTSCLTKIKSLKFLQIMFADSTSAVGLTKRCSIGEKTIAIKEECSLSPAEDEQLSLTQILKDLELILDLEIKNSSCNAEIADINGFSPENVTVDKKLPADYSSHQVWHCPATTYTSKKNNSSDSDSSRSACQSGLQNVEIFQTSVSPIKNNKLGTGKGLTSSEYHFPKNLDIEDVYPCPKQIYQHTENASVSASSRPLEPFCSSPCLEAQFLFPDDNLKHTAYYNDKPCIKNCPLDPKELEELSCETTLETESTIELRTTIAGNSSSFLKDHVPSFDVTLQENNS